MAYHRMDEDECRRFLRASASPGVLAVTRKDGRPHAAPIWFALDDDGTLVFNTGATTVKGHAVRRDGRAVLVVQDDRPPFTYVRAEGPASWSDDLDEVRRWAGVIGGRYMGAERADEYAERNGV